MKMSVWSLTNKAYFSDITVKNKTFIRAHKMAAKASYHRNYVTVTLHVCINVRGDGIHILSLSRQRGLFVDALWEKWPKILYCLIKLSPVWISGLLFGRRDAKIVSPAFNTLCYKKLSYRRGTARCVVSVEILAIARNSSETTCTTSPEPSISCR